MSTNKSDIEQAVENMILAKKRYDMTLKCILAIKHACSKSSFGMTFDGCETPFKYRSESEKSPQPDFICQNGKTFGLYGEIKSSITPDIRGISKEIDDLKRLNKDLIGWKTDDKSINDFGIWLLVHKESLNPFVDEFKKRIKEILRKTVVCSWKREQSLRRSSDVFLIERVYGTSGVADFDKSLSKVIEVEENEILEAFENIRFFRQRPPILHLLSFLWFEAFPSLSDGEDFIISTDGIYTHVKTFYPMWANIDGEHEQVKKCWIKDGLDVLTKIGLCKKVNLEDYEVLYNKNPGHNFDEHIGKKICTSISNVKQQYLPQQTSLTGPQAVQDLKTKKRKK